MPLCWNAAEHRSGHPLDERDRAGNEATTLAFIHNTVANPLVGRMVPGNEYLAVGFKSLIVTSIVQASGLG